MSFPLWARGSSPSERMPGFAGWLRRSFEELGQVLGEWHRSLNYGPVAGAYYPLVFRRHNTVSLGAISVACLHPMVPQFRPVAVSAWCNSGTLTARLRTTGPSNLLAANLSVSSTPVRRNSGADFAINPVPAGTDVWLEIVSVDSGTPTELVVHLLLKDLSKADA